MHRLKAAILHALPWKAHQANPGNLPLHDFSLSVIVNSRTFHSLEPSTTPRGGSGAVVILGRGVVPSLVQTGRAAGKEQNDCADQGTDSSSQDGPDGDAEGGV